METCAGSPEGLLHVMGRWKGKMQEIYLQIKNHCIDLELNGLQKQGVNSKLSLENRHTEEFDVFTHSSVFVIVL